MNAPLLPAPVNTSSAPASASEHVNIFISYASADNGIAVTLCNELLAIDPRRVSCFLDTQSIECGVDFQSEIDQALERADWLVCIFTGEQSEYCGYEIGVFSRVHGLVPGNVNNRLVCLHDVTTLPTLFRPHQNTRVIFPPEGLSDSPNADEDKFFGPSPLAKFFANVYNFKNLYVARDLAESQRQLYSICQKARNVTKAFIDAMANDVRSDSPTQLSVDISVKVAPGTKLTKLPPNAEVSGPLQSMALFGLMPPRQEGRLPSVTWDQIRKEFETPYRSVPLWMERLEQDIVDAANSKILTGLEATLFSNGKIYRTILSRDILYQNGDHKFQVLFVETLPRQFIGKRHSSLILAGIVLASRFRFAYLEEPEVVCAKFEDERTDAEFESNCRQLYYDLERQQHEAIELGLLDPLEFVKAFGDGNRAFAESLLKTANECRIRLVSALPNPEAPINSGNRATVRDAIRTYLHDVEPVNSRFLLAAVDVFRDDLRTQIPAADRPLGDRGPQRP
jgi:hypothetical protein